ncbi:PqqD family protein [Oceanidesulfovibrio indonesiensis]|jgi:propanediol dehydratase large subunit|uniref:PqqD family protein n=1 Tax=Oceanidesulfovibrio indonesiensis TaxID=54767 RepID=A0A7M3MJL8_9BACT|nr:PqqD family protein [Oceanidesulfovibrio indonesiensis]TVM19975.1 PqqD family protein [Oceanidesulfovibrio indonesiensis]
MKLFRKKKRTQTAPTISRAEALAARPVRSDRVAEERTEEGYVRLVYDINYKPWFAKYARRMGTWDDRPMKKKLELDEMGTRAWELMDGAHTVRDIVDDFAAEYRLGHREAEMSVSAFIKELGQRGLIALREGSPTPEE